MRVVTKVSFLSFTFIVIIVKWLVFNVQALSRYETNCLLIHQIIASIRYFGQNVLSILFMLRVLNCDLLSLSGNRLISLSLCMLHAYVAKCFVLAVLYLIIVFSSSPQYPTLPKSTHLYRNYELPCLQVYFISYFGNYFCYRISSPVATVAAVYLVNLELWLNAF